MPEHASPPVPYRQIRAPSTGHTFTVYQAYPPAIAQAALAAGTFVPPLRRGRATWIKPSLRSMAYRSGWAGQHSHERVLAIEITCAGPHRAPEHTCLSHYQPGTHTGHTAWRHRLDTTCMPIQWDPEPDLHHQPPGHPSIQIRLTGNAVTHHAGDWTVSIRDATPPIIQIRDPATAHLPRRSPATAARRAPIPGQPAGQRDRDSQLTRHHSHRPAHRPAQRPGCTRRACLTGCVSDVA
jgi:Domain of unknown function (DUF4291)